MTDFIAEGVDATTPGRTYSHWVEGSHDISKEDPEVIGKEIARIIKETPNIYAITVHVLLGIHVTTMVEEKTNGKD